MTAKNVTAVEVPASHSDARRYLIDEFRKSTVGPGLHEELLRDSPTRTYICGILSPLDMEIDDDQNDELQGGDNESSVEGVPSLINAMYPSAVGITFHVSPIAKAIQLHISAAVYEIIEVEGDVDNPEDLANAQPVPNAKSLPALGGLLAELDELPASKHGDKTAEKDSNHGSEASSGKGRKKKVYPRWKRHPFQKTIAVSCEPRCAAASISFQCGSVSDREP